MAEEYIGADGRGTNQKRYMTIDDARRGDVKPRPEPKIDEDVSKVLGEKVRVNDPRLIRWAAERSRGRDPNDLSTHSNLESEAARRSLKEHFRK